jgi:hypothetical protein
MMIQASHARAPRARRPRRIQRSGPRDRSSRRYRTAVAIAAAPRSHPAARRSIDVERIATTPERFFQALRESSPFPALPYGQGHGSEPGARDAFDAALAVLDTARAPGAMPATFLLDEFLELRTFESFPGLRSVLRDLVGALASSGSLRAHEPLRRARARTLRRRFRIIHRPLGAARSAHHAGRARR